MFLLLLLCCLPGGKAESAFWIDQQERFGRMARPYAQGYAPLIQRHVLAIDLPLLSATAQGPIEATFVPRDAELMPVKADQPFSLRAAGRQVAREGKALRQYLLSFRLALYPDRLNGDYPYAIDVKGADAGGGAVSQRFQFVLHVADGAKNQEPPRGEVVSFRPETPLLVGESGRLLVALKNASATRTLQGLIQLERRDSALLNQDIAQFHFGFNGRRHGFLPWLRERGSTGALCLAGGAGCSGGGARSAFQAERTGLIFELVGHLRF